MQNSDKSKINPIKFLHKMQAIFYGKMFYKKKSCVYWVFRNLKVLRMLRMSILKKSDKKYF